MGVQLANVAVIRWAPVISDRAFRVLIRMALVALDKPSNGQPAGQYFGGIALLSMTLRGGGDPSHRTTRRALSELVQVGAIESLERGKKGTRAVYKLTLDNDPKPLVSGQGCPTDWTDLSHKTGGSGQDSPSFGQTLSPLGTTGATKDDERLEDEVVTSQGDLTSEPDPVPLESISLPVDVNHSRFAACSTCQTYLEPDGSCFVCRRRARMEAS